MTVVLPQAEMYEDELFRYENMPSDAPSVSLEEAIEKSQKRLMVVKKNTDGSLTLRSHQFIKE
ncbi:MAG: hypothetical protein ACRCST_07300 [Turicibacter sp.]